MADLSKLSDADLLALKAGDLTKVSNEGLLLLKSSEPQASVEVTSPEGQQIQPAQFAETGGGAALGRPINRGVVNVQPTPRPLESVLAGATKSAIDPFVGASQLLTGGATSPMAQKLGKEADVYSQANPIAYGAGRVGGALLPAATGGAVTGMLPSFAKMPSLVQNIAMGTALGAVTPEETGKTGAELYKEQGKQGLIGGALGAALTPLQKLAGVLRGPEQPAQMATAVQKAREAGYVVPPTQARGDLANRLMEGVAGKTTTAQNASAKNQETTHKLVAKSLGLPEDEVITSDVLKGIRDEAGKAYEALSNLPVKSGELASSVMNKPAIPEIDPKKMVYDLRLLRNNADAYYKAYGRSADPEQLTKAKQAKAAAQAIETELEKYAESLGKSDLLPALRDARQLIAKTYTIEKTLNPASGTVDAKVLARELKKGKPLSEELKTVAEFASQFPKAAQVTEKMGSLPQISPIDYGLGGLAALLTNPTAMAGVAARPALRAAALSEPVQNRLVQGAKMTPEEINTIKLLLMQGAIPATNAVVKGKENE